TIDLASRHLSAAYPDQIVLARLYALPVHLFVFFYLSGHRRDRRSFPTRRSSDLDVVDPAARAVEPAGGRGGIDNVPFVLLDEHRSKGLDAPDHAIQVDAQHPLPVVHGVLPDRPVDADAGVVEHQVRTAEAAFAQGGQFFYLLQA